VCAHHAGSPKYCKIGTHDVRVLDGAAEERLAQRIHLLSQLPLMGNYLYRHCAPTPPTLVHLPKRPAQQGKHTQTQPLADRHAAHHLRYRCSQTDKQKQPLRRVQADRRRYPDPQSERERHTLCQAVTRARPHQHQWNWRARAAGREGCGCPARSAGSARGSAGCSLHYAPSPPASRTSHHQYTADLIVQHLVILLASGYQMSTFDSSSCKQG